MHVAANFLDWILQGSDGEGLGEPGLHCGISPIADERAVGSKPRKEDSEGVVGGGHDFPKILVGVPPGLQELVPFLIRSC